MNGKKKEKRLYGMRRKEAIAGYLFLVPAALCLLVWTVLPIGTSFWYSLTDFDILTNMNFIGLENYKTMIRDKEWMGSLWKTVKYVLMYIPLLYVFSLGAAELVKHLKVFSGVFKTTFFLPIVVSSVACGAIFKLIFSTKLGPINKTLAAIGLEKINFLGDPQNALFSCVILVVWMEFGYNMLIFLAALLDVPQYYYEAAEIDGATKIQMFRYITFPALGRTSVFVLTMAIIGSFQTYDIIRILTDGGPNYATTLAIHRIYMNAFYHYRMGYACALTVTLFLIILVVTLVQLKLTSAMAEKGWE